MSLSEVVFGRFSPLYLLRLFIPGFTPWISLILFPDLLGRLNTVILVGANLLLGMVLYSLPIDSHHPLRNVWKKYRSGIEAEIKKIVLPNQPNCGTNIRALYDVFFYTKLSVSERNRVHYRVTLYYAYSRIFAASFFMAGIFVVTVVFYVLGQFEYPLLISWLSATFMETSDFLFAKFVIVCLLNSGIAWITAKEAVLELTEATSFESYLISYHKEEIKDIFTKALKTYSAKRN